MSWFILITLLFLLAFFSLIEEAIESAKRSKINSLAKEQKKGASLALKIIDTPEKYRSAIDFALTLLVVVIGVLAADTFTSTLEKTFANTGVYNKVIASAVVVITLAFSIVIFGQLLPRKIAAAYPHSILRGCATLLRIVMYILIPFTKFADFVTFLFTKLFRLKPATDNKITEEEILAAVKMGASEGEVQDVEHDIVERVFDLGDRDVATVMTHRSDLLCVDINSSEEEIRKILYEEMHSYYPVIDGHLDNLLGVISLRDLVYLVSHGDKKLSSLVSKPYYLPETTSTYKALEQFKKSQIYYAFISDEFGSLQGMITSLDIMEALLGRMSIPDENEETIIKQEENVWIADGQYSFYDFLSYFDIEDDSDNFDYNTLGGLILEITECIPEEGEKVHWKDFEFEVSKMDNARIDKIIVRRKPAEEDSVAKN